MPTHSIAKSFLLIFWVWIGLSSSLCAEGPRDRLVINVGTLAPKGVGWANQVENILIPAVLEATDHTVFLRVYWGGIMGDDEDVLDKMRTGVLGGAGLSGQGAGMACSSMNVLALPFLFQDYGEVDYVRSKMIRTFDHLVEGEGFVLISWLDQDFDTILSIEQPLASLNDFQGARIINWYGPLEKMVIERLGAIPVETDVPSVSTTMRLGKVDGNIGPGIWAVGAQLYTVAKYLNTMKIRYSPVLVICTQDFWRKMDASYRRDILAARQEITERVVEEVRSDNARSLDAMLRYGLQERNPSPKELGLIKKALEPIAEEMVGVLYSQELLYEVQEHLEEYRSQTH